MNSAIYPEVADLEIPFLSSPFQFSVLLSLPKTGKEKWSLDTVWNTSCSNRTHAERTWVPIRIWKLFCWAQSFIWVLVGCRGAEGGIGWVLDVQSLLSDREGANHPKQKDNQTERSKHGASIQRSTRATATWPQLLSSVFGFTWENIYKNK